MHVPDTTIKKAVAYIKSCYRAQHGGFTYMPNSGAPGFARTAAGLCVLFLSGEYEAKEIPEGVKYLKSNFQSPLHFYYGHYYAAHAMHQVGGKEWEDWYARLVQYFVTSNSQHADGSWSTTNRREVGPVYQTSIAVIILSVPAHYLPVFQR
jgi:mannose/cellobiose epimerase-like protein (N-acyl-D-glucosamine 2-epimerase family)